MKKTTYIILLMMLIAPCSWAEFPTTPVLDTFNRANEGPPMTGWTDVAGGVKVLSNTAVGSAAGANVSLYSTAFSSNQEAYVKISTTPTDGTDVQIFARFSGGPGNGYAVTALKVAGSSNDVIGLIRYDGGSPVGIGSDSTQEYSSADSIGIVCIGSSISVLYKPSAGSWTVLQTVTDATYSGSSNIGLLVNNTSPGVVDDFGGGNVVVGNVYSNMVIQGGFINK